MGSAQNIEEIIGYHFKAKNLLELALTHSSYANERHHKHQDNERLEFLGDAVLEMVSSDFLFKEFPSYTEGQLSKLRASLVCEPTLAFCATDIDLGRFVRLGKGEERTGGRDRKSVLSDALEALIGAIYLDGGIEPAKDFILGFILTDIEHKRKFYDAKTTLQEIIQGRCSQVPDYRLVSESGPDHAKEYVYEVWAEGKCLGKGSGGSKKGAEQEAAFQALTILQANTDKENSPQKAE